MTWQINSDEPHTVTFLSGQAAPPDPIPVPNGGPHDIMANPVAVFPSRAADAPVETYDGAGYRHSGHLSNGALAPPLEAYSLTFDKPGVYQYSCLLHGTTMKGEIVVEPASADVPSQAEIDAQAQAEMAPLLALAEETRAAATNPDLVRTELGPTAAPSGMCRPAPRVWIFASRSMTSSPRT
jgi:plastocyanin